MTIVQKFGGTSVATIQRIQYVANIIAETARAGNRVVVVVSAMAGETNKFIQWARELNPTPSPREMDLLLSSGERITCALTSMAVETLGFPSIALTGRQAGIKTQGMHTQARIDSIHPTNLLTYLNEGKIVVIAGFQGIHEDTQSVTTLGRGGSDLSAVAIAAVLKADVCEIYTDVDGIYTADPNMVPNARKLVSVTFDEMLEMSSLGAKVLQMRSVELAMKYNVSLCVRSSFQSTPGTYLIKEYVSMEQPVVSSVVCERNQTKCSLYGIPNQVGSLAHLFHALSQSNINVDMIIQNLHSDHAFMNISFTISDSDREPLEQVIHRVHAVFSISKEEFQSQLSKISVVGIGMRNHHGVAAKMFETLNQFGIEPLMVSTSEIVISCLVDPKFTELSVRVLHEAFELGADS